MSGTDLRGDEGEEVEIEEEDDEEVYWVVGSGDDFVAFCDCSEVC